MKKFESLPGETPLDDLSGLLLKHVRTREQLNEAEAENILKALAKYFGGKLDFELAAFDLAWCYRLHREMFGDVWVWAGQKRTLDLNLGIPHYQIDVSLQNLLDDLRHWKRDMPFSEQTVRLHHRAVSIHPFLNGNGRWARLLSNIWSALHDQPVVLWPETTIGATSLIRQEYLAAIRTADAGDYEPLVKMQHLYAASLPT